MWTEEHGKKNLSGISNNWTVPKIFTVHFKDCREGHGGSNKATDLGSLLSSAAAKCETLGQFKAQFLICKMWKD